MKFKYRVDSTKILKPYSWFSQLFACWTFTLLSKRFKKKSCLDSNDLPNLTKTFSSKRLGDLFERAWFSQCKNKAQKLSLIEVLFKNFALKYILICIGIGIDELIFRIGQLLCLKWLMESFEFKNSETVPISSRYLYATGICLFTFLHSFSYQWILLHVSYLGVQIKIGLSSMIYRKTLRLSSSACSSSSNSVEGQGINLLSNETSRFDNHLYNSPHIFIGPLTFCVLSYILWMEVGFISAASGLGSLVVFLPIQIGVGTLSKRYRIELSKRIDQRSNLMAQIVTGFKIIKLYGWEHLFASKIDHLRRNELKSIWKSKLVQAFIVGLGLIIPKLSTGITMIVYFLLGNPLVSSKVFFIVIMFNILRQGIGVFLPHGISDLSELWAVVLKVQDFLLLDENIDQSETGINNPKLSTPPLETQDPELIMENISVTYVPWESPALENVNLHVKGRKLVMIVGAVGSGKTTLLHAILGELKLTSGNIYHFPSGISYTSQTPWIFSGTIKQNILLGDQCTNESKLEEILDACGLTEDLKEMSEGLNTQVGSKGSSLSGGQKARISLARTLYSSDGSSIILIDDPLASVDSKVGKHIFQNVFCKYLQSNLRILVTHGLENLVDADWIVVLEKGKVRFQGTFSELEESGIELSKIVEQEEPFRSPVPFIHKNMFQSEQDTKNSQIEISQTTINQKIIIDKILKPKKSSSTNTNIGYLKYYQLGNSTLCVTFLAFTCIFTQIVYSLFDIWAADWSAEFQATITRTYTRFTNETYEYGLAGILIAVILTIFTRAIWLYRSSLNVGRELHKQMFCGLIRAPISFYDANSPGEIMNRFTKDLGEVEIDLPDYLFQTIQYSAILFGVLFVVVISNYYLITPSVIFLLLIFGLRHYFVTISKELKCKEANEKSPMYTHFSDTFHGLTTIRVTQSTTKFIGLFDSLQDNHSIIWISYISICRWFGMWIEILSSTFLVIITIILFCLNGNDSESGVWIGLAISSILSLTSIVQYGIRMATEVDNTMKSFERCLEYTSLEPEASLTTSQISPPPNWPGTGTIQFENVSLAYGNEENLALNNLNFTIRDHEKIGIVGRTGAGKSSLIVAIFRLIEPNGSIRIDGFDISQIGLHELRQAISIIPQDPILFPGTIRYNLDPFGNYNDINLWACLKDVELLYKISSLDDYVADGGRNFSVGEKQLICLARTILRKNKILILDEATASVDTRTESMIHNAIQTKFPDCTIISIAHRLSTVASCDRIMLLNHGEIMEFDTPQNLLSNPSSYYSELIQSSQNDKLN